MPVTKSLQVRQRSTSRALCCACELASAYPARLNLREAHGRYERSAYKFFVRLLCVTSRFVALLDEKAGNQTFQRREEYAQVHIRAALFRVSMAAPLVQGVDSWAI